MATKKYWVGGFPATNQQADAIRAGLGLEDLVIEAGAGTGKTTLLAALAQEKKGKGLYLTFNKGIAEEAKKVFPTRKVKCCTAHSLAYQAVGKKYRSRLKMRQTGGLVARHLSLTETCGFSAFAMGNLTIETVRRYCYSASEHIEEWHVPKKELTKIENEADRALVQEETFINAQALWNEMSKARSKMPITHDFYLKKWALSAPDLNVDYILMDESQDTNDVMIALLQAQGCQIIWVGDTYQSIYAWRGAVNAMEKIDVTHRTQILQSFRFGEAIAAVANAVLEKHVETDMRLMGFEPINSVVGPISRPDAIITRTNAEAMRYLVDAVDNNVSVTFSGGTSELSGQISALRTLSKTGKTNHVDFGMFKSYDDFTGYCFSKDGAEFKPLSLMIKKYGFDYLTQILASIKDVTEQNADLIVSTAHKAKGLEWNNVKLGNDFKYPGTKGYRKEESNLLYVAVTRAKKGLDISDCKAALMAMGLSTQELDARDEEASTLDFTPVSAEERQLKKAIADYEKIAAYLVSKGIDLEKLQPTVKKKVAVKKAA